MVEITREGLFTLDSAIVHKAVFHCLPYTHPPPYKFLGFIYTSVCLPTCLPACLSVYLSVCVSVSCGGVNRQSLHYKAICVLIYFIFIDLTFIFDCFLLAVLLHLLCFTFCVLNFVFRKCSFLYCVLPFAFLLSAFYFCLLCLNFCILYFGFGFSHASSMIKGISVPLQMLATDKHTDRQTIDSVSDMGRQWK